MPHALDFQGRVKISGTFECRNAAGEVIKTMPMEGFIPFSELPVDLAKQLIESEKPNDDDCQ